MSNPTSKPALKNGNRLVSEAILDQLQLWGVKRIYGVSGDAIFGLLDSLSKRKDMHFIAVKHESVAAMMASAEAKLTGKLAVCVAQQGPGLGNLMNGLADAFFDQVPVVVITGQAPLNKVGTHYKQYIDQQKWIDPIAGFSSLVTSAQSTIDILSMAIHIAITKRTVSHLSIPSDLFGMNTQVTPQPRMEHSNSLPDPSSIQQASQIMTSAKCPMILIGTRAEAQASQSICQLAEKWGAGIVESHGALGIIPGETSYLLGNLGPSGVPQASNIFRQADVVLVIGTLFLPKSFAPKARLIQVDPYLTNLGKGIPTEIGLTGEAQIIIPSLLAELKDYNPDEGWVQQIIKAKPAIQQQIESEKNLSGHPIGPARIVKSIEATISPNAIIALDTGDAAYWFMRTFQAKQQTILLSDHWRTMGFGLPAALAAKLCMPNNQVICLTGDGGLEMVLADLMTAIRYECKIVVILLNNQTLQMERDKALIDGYNPEGTRLTNPDFSEMARALGWDAYSVDTEEELEPVMQQALKSQKPAFINIDTARVPYPNQQTN